MSYPHMSGDCADFHDRVIDWTGVRKLNRSTDGRPGYLPDVVNPEIVTLCGSTRFYDEFRRQNLRLTIAGVIVLSIGCDTKSDGDLFETDDVEALKSRLDELHKRKIDLSDSVLVLNVGGYIGESTRGEIAYAQRTGKPVRYLVPVAVSA